MEDVAKYVDRILVMRKGSLAMDEETSKVFSRYKELEEMHLAAPQVTYVMNALKDRGFPVNTDVNTVTEARDEIIRMLSK
jgi:energy-coupling factor transport system ATP-binding protein